jgi:hypothetical protein
LIYQRAGIRPAAERFAPPGVLIAGAVKKLTESALAHGAHEQT